MKNVFSMAPVLMPSYRLIVNEQVRSELEHVANVEFEEIEFVRPFSFPFWPGDFSFENDPAFQGSDAWAPDIVERFATRFRCELPQYRYFEVIVAAVFVEGAGHHLQSFVINESIGGVNVPARFGVSSTLLADYGLTAGGGMQCSMAVWKVLEKHVVPPFYYARTFEL